MEKINLGMTLIEKIFLMTEGDVKAEIVLTDIATVSRSSADILMAALDSLDIRGSRIWKLYDSCCRRDMDKFFKTVNFIRFGAYSPEEVELNFQMPEALPFMSDDVNDEDYRTERDTNYITPFSEKWNEYAQAHRATLVPKLDEFKKKNVGEGLGI